MKLLGWMHRKLRQNTGETLKELSIGQPSLDDQQYYYSKPNYCSRTSKRDNHIRNSFASFEAAGAEEKDIGEESSAFSDLFHCFLAIGTFGSDPVIADPSTPKFSISLENLAERDTAATESDLRLINEELEKVLGDDGSNDSSGRNSHASAGRSSHGSTITLSGKSMEGTNSHGNGTIICPLQGYLFGTAAGMPETMMPKKENRTSLGDLFQKTKMTEENSGTKYDRGEKRTEKESDKSAVHLVKKILKKKLIHAPSWSSTVSSVGTTDSASAEKKLHKILHMFHRKVHPESSVATEPDKSAIHETKNDIMNEERNDDADRMALGEDITSFPQRSLSRKSTCIFNSQSCPSQVALTGTDSNGNKECWIKTDTDYLVLEL